jgi:hypothetical protein
MKPVEEYFDFYFDKRSELAKQGKEFRIGISPPDFYLAIKNFRRQSNRSLRHGVTSIARIEERERKKVVKLLEESHDFRKYIDYLLSVCEEIVMIFFTYENDVICQEALHKHLAFYRRYHSCFRFLVIDLLKEEDATRKFIIPGMISQTQFYFAYEEIGKIFTYGICASLENFTGKLYERVKMTPCRVPESNLV